MKPPIASDLDHELDLFFFADLAHQLSPSARLELLAEYVAELADDPDLFQMFQHGVELRLLRNQHTPAHT
jgi:hypothetical protein